MWQLLRHEGGGPGAAATGLLFVIAAMFIYIEYFAQENTEIFSYVLRQLSEERISIFSNAP